MASWHEAILVAAALWLPACALTAGTTVPADRAENAQPAQRAGFVQPGPGGVVAQVAVEETVREDALRAWPGAQRAQLQVHTDAVNWADGSLGCPQPGQTYTQAMVAGWRLVVRGMGREAVYHASQRGQWLLCPGGNPSPGQPGVVTR